MDKEKGLEEYIKTVQETFGGCNWRNEDERYDLCLHPKNTLEECYFLGIHNAGVQTCKYRKFVEDFYKNHLDKNVDKKKEVIL